MTEIKARATRRRGEKKGVTIPIPRGGLGVPIPSEEEVRVSLPLEQILGFPCRPPPARPALPGTGSTRFPTLASIPATLASNASSASFAAFSFAWMSFFFFAWTFLRRKNSSRSNSSSSPLMYATVFSSLGVTTFSNALTLRFVVLIARSRVMNAVWRLASSTSSFTAPRYARLQFWSCFPPPPRPVMSARPPSAPSRWCSNRGSFTPATLSVLARTRTFARSTPSRTVCLMPSPATYFASVSANAEARIAVPISRFAATILARIWR